MRQISLYLYLENNEEYIVVSLSGNNEEDIVISLSGKVLNSDNFIISLLLQTSQDKARFPN